MAWPVSVEAAEDNNGCAGSADCTFGHNTGHADVGEVDYNGGPRRHVLFRFHDNGCAGNAICTNGHNTGHADVGDIPSRLLCTLKGKMMDCYRETFGENIDV